MCWLRKYQKRPPRSASPVKAMIRRIPSSLMVIVSDRDALRSHGSVGENDCVLCVSLFGCVVHVAMCECVQSDYEVPSFT